MTVELWGYEGCGLVVPAKTGVVYTNQVGGMAMIYPEVEGFFVPVPEKLAVTRPDGKTSFSERIHPLLCCYHTGEAELTNEEVATVIREVKQYGLTVDVLRLKEMTEAWIPVIIEEEFCAMYASEDLIDKPAYLTYYNCD